MNEMLSVASRLCEGAAETADDPRTPVGDYITAPAYICVTARRARDLHGLNVKGFGFMHFFGLQIEMEARAQAQAHSEQQRTRFAELQRFVVG